MESVRLKIHQHMTSVVGEEILCVLDKALEDDVCSVTLNVRMFVLERLSAAGDFMFSLFQREMETLETLLEKQNKLLDIDFDMDMDLQTTGMSVYSVTYLQTTFCRYVCYTGMYNIKLHLLDLHLCIISSIDSNNIIDYLA